MSEEYIGRDKVLAFQNELEPVIVFGQPACYSATKDADLVAFINDIPAADVVEVVRCRDCKHAPIFWDEDDPFAVKWPHRGANEVDDETCPHFVGDYSYTRPPDPDGFCEKGERRP